MPDDPKLSRRQLLRGGFLVRMAAAAAEMVGVGSKTLADQAPGTGTGGSGGDGDDGGKPIGRRFTLPIHRPPGAVSEASFLAGCTRCNACIAACPVGAIVHAPAKFRQAAGTPMIDVHHAACIMCHDTPCIAACEPRVLRAEQPRKMGVAWIQNMACLAHTGSFCTVCSERCPVPGAIEVTAGKPRILEDVCTGCGVCATVCPAPVNAVVVMPLADRPMAG
jgi:ferredoxin-type protein NapG